MEAISTTDKPSYKNIVMEKEAAPLDPSAEGLQFVDYDQLYIPSTCKVLKIPAGKRDLLVDMIDPMCHLTQNVVSYYSFHNIANNLCVSDVLDCFEASLRVEIVSDIEYDYRTDEER